MSICLSKITESNCVSVGFEAKIGFVGGPETNFFLRVPLLRISIVHTTILHFGTICDSHQRFTMETSSANIGVTKQIHGQNAVLLVCKYIWLYYKIGVERTMKSINLIVRTYLQTKF